MIRTAFEALTAAAPGPVSVTPAPIARATQAVVSAGSGIVPNLTIPKNGDLLGVGPGLADPLLNSAMVLIPAAVALMSLHKLLDHRETGGGFLVEMLTKAGGAILIIELIKNISGLT